MELQRTPFRSSEDFVWKSRGLRFAQTNHLNVQRTLSGNTAIFFWNLRRFRLVAHGTSFGSPVYIAWEPI